MSTRPVEFYVDDAGDHRWRVRAEGNNEIVAASSEGFETRAGAEDNFRLVEELEPGGDVEGAPA